MKQFNIYAGLGGSFGGARYQFTTLAETYEDAMDEAYDAACEEFESYAGVHRLFSTSDAVEEYCNEAGIDKDDMDDDDWDVIDEMRNEVMESWISYKAVPTEEDTIDEEDLILGYYVEDDSSDQTDSK